MKRLTLFAITILLCSGPVLAEPRAYTIDSDHFSIGFLVDHVGYARQLGQFLEANGQFVYDEAANELISGEVNIAADSVFTNHNRRDRHLKSDDFLHARRYGEIHFKATGYRPDDPRSGTLSGDLTLLGQTHPVDLDVTINKTGAYPFGHKKHTIGISAQRLRNARTTIERSRWGMSYAVDDGLVGDDVELMFELEAVAR